MSYSTTKQGQDLLTFGYIRENIQMLLFSHRFPKDIKELIAMYYICVMAEWELVENIAYKYELITDEFEYQANLRAIQSGGYAICRVSDKYAISSSFCKTFFFEVTLIKEPMKIDFMFGYLKYPVYPKVANSPQKVYLGQHKKGEEFALYIHYGWEHLSVENKEINHKGKLTKDFMKGHVWKKGDRFGIFVDFIEKKSFAYFNGQNIGLMYSDIPEQILPAVSVFYEDTVLQISNWQASIPKDYQNDNDHP